MNVAFSLMTLEPGRPGGSETNACGVLTEFSRDGHDVHATVLATDRVRDAYADLASSSVSFQDVPGYPGAQTPVRRLASMAAAPLLGVSARRIVDPAIDVVHYPLTVPVPPLRVPAVVTLFDLNHHDMPQLWSPAMRLYRRFAYDLAARRAQVVVTSSAFSRDRIVEVLRIAPERIRVIALGIDHARFTTRPADHEPELPQLPERFVVYPSALHPHKNHDRLLQALARTRDDELGLVLTGQTNGMRGRLEQRARELGLADRVVHLGFLERELLPVLYRRARALVFPSLLEGFGAPPLEAMACGCPVASSFAASLQEICEGAAEPLDPHDVASITAAIDTVTTDSPRREHLIGAGLERARAFTWTRTAELHVDAYRAALT